jgi:DNA-binding HxlR family transcriptional regulator
MGRFDNYGVINVPEEVFSKMSACPIDVAFRIMGKKFMILILRELILFRSNRFGDLLKSIDGINKKTLSIRLRELEKNEIIKRKIYIRNPVRAEYIVTKKGKMLSAVLEQMAAFSLSYCYNEVFKDKKRRSFKEIIGRRPSSL